MSKRKHIPDSENDFRKHYKKWGYSQRRIVRRAFMELFAPDSDPESRDVFDHRVNGYLVTIPEEEIKWVKSFNPLTYKPGQSTPQVADLLA